MVCQKPVQPRNLEMVVLPTFGLPPAPTGCATATATSKLSTMSPDDYVDSNASQAMPNAYFGRSREGAYIPLKLTRTHQVWHSASDAVHHCNNAYRVPPGGGPIGQVGQYIVPTNPASSSTYPHFYETDFSINTLSGYPFVGCPSPAYCNDNWADISFRNLSVATSLTFYYRFGFECQVAPQSEMAPHLKLSPPHDPMAISRYFAVSRELKDAYPADYNDLGKILKTIGSVVSAMGPALAFIPEVGPFAMGAAEIMGPMLDKLGDVADRTKGPTKGSVASASDKEALKTAIANAPQPQMSRAAFASKRAARKAARTVRVPARTFTRRRF